MRNWDKKTKDWAKPQGVKPQGVKPPPPPEKKSLEKAVSVKLDSGVPITDLVVVIGGEGEPITTSYGLKIFHDKHLPLDNAFLVDLRKMKYKLEPYEGFKVL